MTTDTDLMSEGAVLPVFGEIDVANAAALREQLFSLCEGGRAFGVVDMSDLSFIDSAGLSALIAARKYLEAQQCEMRLVITRPNVRRLFEVTGLTEFFDIFDSVEAASGSATQLGSHGFPDGATSG
ncbi:MAG TPA: STAS domain-containing protein [Acidimicrobiales bacterium]|nr:STAS domain-containing protein [Acidimicrobiales bacterium]